MIYNRAMLAEGVSMSATISSVQMQAPVVDFLRLIFYTMMAEVSLFQQVTIVKTA